MHFQINSFKMVNCFGFAQAFCMVYVYQRQKLLKSSSRSFAQIVLFLRDALVVKSKLPNQNLPLQFNWQQQATSTSLSFKSAIQVMEAVYFSIQLSEFFFFLPALRQMVTFVQLFRFTTRILCQLFCLRHGTKNISSPKKRHSN